MSDLIGSVLHLVLPLALAGFLTSGLTHYLGVWGSVLGQLIFGMPAYAVAAYSIVMAPEMDVTLGDVWDGLRENYLDAVLMGILLLPVIAGTVWVMQALSPTVQQVLGIRLASAFLGAVVTLVPLYFMMHLVDGNKGALAAFSDGLASLGPHIHHFLLLALLVSVIFMAAGFVPLLGSIFMLLAQVFGAYTLGSMYYEISGKEKQDEQLTKTSRDISKMPSVWKPGSKVGQGGRPEVPDEPMGQVEKPAPDDPPPPN